MWVMVGWGSLFRVCIRCVSVSEFWWLFFLFVVVMLCIYCMFVLVENEVFWFVNIIVWIWVLWLVVFSVVVNWVIRVVLKVLWRVGWFSYRVRIDLLCFICSVLFIEGVCDYFIYV